MLSLPTPVDLTLHFPPERAAISDTWSSRPLRLVFRLGVRPPLVSEPPVSLLFRSVLRLLRVPRVRCQRPVPSSHPCGGLPVRLPCLVEARLAVPEHASCHLVPPSTLVFPPGLAWSEVPITINAFEQMHESRHVCLSQGCLFLLFWLPY